MEIFYCVIAFIVYIDIKHKAVNPKVPPSIVALFWLPLLALMILGFLWYGFRNLIGMPVDVSQSSTTREPTEEEMAYAQDMLRVLAETPLSQLDSRVSSIDKNTLLTMLSVLHESRIKYGEQYQYSDFDPIVRFQLSNLYIVIRSKIYN
jgi:hypothetical protein